MDNVGRHVYDFQRELITNEYPRQIWNKSRQIGFSMGLAIRAFRRGLMRRSFEAMYISVTARLSAEWLDKIRVLMLLDGIEPVIDKYTEIKLRNGSRFLAMPQKAGSVRSFSPDEVYLDEFAHYAQDKKLLTAITPSLSRKDKKRTLILGSTPFGDIGEFNRIFADDKDVYVKYKIDLVDAIAQGCPLDFDVCKADCPDEDSFGQEYMCQFVSDMASFFPYEMIKSCWNTDLYDMSFEEMGACKNMLQAGYDPGKKVDSGVFIVRENVDGKQIIRHIKEWQGTPYTQQLEYIKQAMKIGKITKLRVDRTGVGEKIYEDLDGVFGCRVDGVIFTNASKEKMIIDLKVLFQDKKIEIPYNMKLTNQLHALQRIITEAKNTRYTHKQGGHDDFVWSLALACDSIAEKIISARFLGE